LKGLLEVFERLFALGGKGVDRVKRHRAKKAADNVDALHFPPTGFRRPLEKIASGQSSVADVDALDSFYRDTSPSVANAVHALKAYRDVVRKQCGARASAKLEQLLDGPDGKFSIRYYIQNLVEMIRCGRYSDADVQALARTILTMIDEFNDKLIDLHDMIFPPTGVPR